MRYRKKELLSTYSDYWQKKTRRNIERDKKVEEYYKNAGWTILRFWTFETEKSLNNCIAKTIISPVQF
jgi:DNA mismatch endonuclease (patch repair protein)